jgi:two-component system, chemotaxis family, sensor kinase CheA
LSSQYISDPMQEMFIFETSQQLEQLEQSVINTESAGGYSNEIINEIFRIMHTIKSSAAMMLFSNISKVAHFTEDLFYFIREDKPENIDISTLCDLVLEAVDFMKLELEKIKNGDAADGEPEPLIEKTKEYLNILKQNNNSTDVSINNNEHAKKQFYISSTKSFEKINNNTFKAIIRFQDGCEMENIRAFTITHNLKDITEEFRYIPEDIINNNDSSEIIKRDGFKIYIKTDKSYEFMQDFFMQVAFLDNLSIVQLDDDEEFYSINNKSIVNNELKISKNDEVINEKEIQFVNNNQGQSIISVSVEKLDKLMDLVGEMVIAEAMVTQNPDLKGLTLDNFSKSARQLRKITGELQDMVMSIRMVPLGPTFFKMNRIVRDMSKKLNKEVHLDIIGEDTEVDKNIIEHIGDPLMHLVRNAVDHGVETTEERISIGKAASGTITLEAKNSGSEVLIVIRDDGKGLNKDRILQKAMENGLLNKTPEEMTDREIFNLIFFPGFSTKEAVTEFSGRGVGMDVVINNIEAVGGAIQVESFEGKGTTITLKIPLTLAIIDGMNIRVGSSRYTIPITSIKESFRPKENEVFKDPDENEMIMIRGQCYPILRLHELYKVKTEVTNVSQGIIIMLESESKTVCLLADELIGEQQVVVKALPKYIKDIKKIDGISGCTLLGDGSISLILDVEGFVS